MQFFQPSCIRINTHFQKLSVEKVRGINRTSWLVKSLLNYLLQKKKKKTVGNSAMSLPYICVRTTLSSRHQGLIDCSCTVIQISFPSKRDVHPSNNLTVSHIHLQTRTLSHTDTGSLQPYFSSRTRRLQSTSYPYQYNPEALEFTLYCQDNESLKYPAESP